MKITVSALRGFLFFVFVVSAILPVPAGGQQEISSLKTVAEASDFRATCRSHECESFVDTCDLASHVTCYDYGKTLDQRPMVAAVVANPPVAHPFQGLKNDSRLRIVLLGNIHSGECSGKEALLALLRELAADPNHPWLRNAIVIIAPNYNADANDRIGLEHRPGQLGPEEGMGLRENTMGLDLNRDFMKLQSPEARALVRLIHEFDPHMFIDCHTTNGSKHQYKLTYDIPHNPTCRPEIRDYLRQRMMPAVTEDLLKKGLKSFYYGNFNRDNTEWMTFGDEPRYSTEYVGLRGILGILSEDYSYATYRERIEATDLFVRACVEQLLADGDRVRKMLADIRESDRSVAATSPDKLLVHLASKLAAFEEPFTVAGFKDSQPHDYQVRFLGDYQPAKTVNAPWCYLVPAEFSLQVERLAMHGIEIERLVSEATLPVTLSSFSSIEPVRFQGLPMVAAQTRAREEQRNIPAETFVIRTGQPLARLITYLLEPESNDGLVAWKFFDSQIGKGLDYPVVRVEKAVNLMTESVDSIRPGTRLKLADIFGPDRMEIPDPQLDQIQWTADGSGYVLDRGWRRVVTDAETGGEVRLRPLVEPAKLTEAFSAVKGIGQTEITAMTSSEPALSNPGQSIFVLRHEKRTFIFDAKSNRALEPGAGDDACELFEVDPTGTRVAWVQGDNLYVLEAGSDPKALTSDGNENLLHGKFDWVYQEELYGRGNFKAYWWSPDGKSIAWLRTDESPVKRYTVVDHLPIEGRLEVTPYPKAGDPLPHVALHCRNLESGDEAHWPAVELAPEGGPESLVSRVTWERNAASLLVQVQNRTQTWLDLVRVDPADKTARRLFRDSTPAWITSPGDPMFLDDGSFLWLSPRSGFRTLYHYAEDGSLIRQLVDKPWEVRSLEACDARKRIAYFSACPVSPFRVQPMKVSLDGGDPELLVDLPGSQTVRFNRDLSLFLCESGSLEKPDTIGIYRADGTFLRTIIANEVDWLRHIDVAPAEFISIPARNPEQGPTIDAMLIKPSSFAADRKWPVILHVYAGPQAPRIRDRFGGQSMLWHQYLAQQGFVVLVVDNRSASFRAVSQAWPVYKKLAERELEDVLTAVDWLKATGWASEKQIGIWGWSYGGYMTAWAMTHSDVFAAGIAGAPVTDWRNYDAIYTERFMTTPQENPDGYKASSVIESASGLSGRLMLIHGTIDDNVHVSNTLQLADALQKAGHQFDLMLYPNNRHAVRDPVQQLHLQTLMSEFFRKHLMDNR
jgi:dipeptidyl-peptidase 4